MVPSIFTVCFSLCSTGSQLFLFCFKLQLVYLPDRKREYFVDDDDISLDSELSLEGKLDANNPDESARFDRRHRKRGMLGWFKLKVLDNGLWIA